MTSLTLFSVLRAYLETGALFALLTGCLALTLAVARRSRIAVSPRAFVRAVYFLILAAIALPFLMLSAPKEALLRPQAQIWSGMSGKAAAPYALIASAEALTETSSGLSRSGFLLSHRGMAAAGSLLFVGLAASLLAFGIRAARLRRFLRGQSLVRCIGRVRIAASDETATPFSVWSPRAAWAVVPSDLFGKRDALRIAVHHELQHHRSGDTRWVYFFEFFKALYFWNPAIYLLIRQVSEMQEFACDERLVGHRKVSPQAYGRCLLQAAETAVRSRAKWVGTAQMAVHRNGMTLTRRVEMLFEYKKTAPNKGFFALATLGTLALMLSAAYASTSALQGRRLSLEEAQALARKTTAETTVPIDMNDLVLEKLNRIVGTPEGRRRFQAALKRMPEYQPMIEKHMKQWKVPTELLAVPIVESGYRNDLVSPHRAAGLWQFIPWTANRYKLTVDKKKNIDKRLHPEKATVAAMNYLSDLYRIFGDWRFALKAYNEGERRVDELRKKLGSDPWVVERANTTESYLSHVIASIIVYKNPSLLN